MIYPGRKINEVQIMHKNMSEVGKSLSTEDIRNLVIQNEQNCRLYLHKTDNLKETLNAQNQQIKELNAETLQHEAEIIMMEKQIISLNEMIQKKTLILKEEKSKLDDLQNQVWTEREQFEKRVVNYKRFKHESINHSVLKNITEEKTMNEELASLQGQVNALSNYVEYTNKVTSSIKFELEELSAKKAHLVERCLS